MAQRTISPYANQQWAGAASNLASVFFPSGQSEARGRLAGQQLAELAARTRKQQAEAFGVEDQNTALAAEALAAAGFDPSTVAIMRAGRGNAAQLADAFQTVGQVVADRAAGDAFAGGDYAGTGASRLRGGRLPLETNKVSGGYQVNPYETGGQPVATGETLADIAATEALVRQRDAAAGYSKERTDHPERFRAPGAGAKPPKPVTVSMSDTKSLADEIARIVPTAKPEDVMVATAAASDRIKAGQAPAEAVTGSIADVFDITTTPAHESWLPFGFGDTPAKTEVKRRANAPAPKPAEPTPAANVPVPQAAANYLRANPNLAAAFDAKYGAGAAARVLGGQ